MEETQKADSKCDWGFFLQLIHQCLNIMFLEYVVWIFWSHEMSKVSIFSLAFNWTNFQIIHSCLTSYRLEDHPYITSANGLGGWARWGQKNCNFYADVQYCLCLSRVGEWVRKSPKWCWRNIGMVPKYFFMTV